MDQFYLFFSFFFFSNFKVLIEFEFVTILLHFYVSGFGFFLGPEACGIVAPQAGIELASPTLDKH